MNNQAETIKQLTDRLEASEAECRRLKEILETERDILHTYFQSTEDLHAFMDRESVFRMVNPAFCRFLGKTADEIIGRTGHELFLRDEEDFCRDRDKAVMESLEPDIEERRIEGSSGSSWYQVNRTPVPGRDGRVAGVYCSLRDITELKQAALEQKRFFELVPDLVCVVSTDGLFRKVNTFWEKVLGYRVDELLSMSCFDLMHPDDQEPTKQEIERQMTGHETIAFLNRYRAKDGSYRWLEWNASPADNGNLYAVARDITGRLEEEKHTRLWADAFRYCAYGIAVGLPSSNRILTCNEAYARIRGLRVDEIEGSAILDMYAPEERERIRENIRRADLSGSVSFETGMLRGEGGAFPVQLDIVTVSDDEGNPVYRIATIQDISERKQNQQKLLESETQFRSVVESAPEAIFIQSGGCFAYLNPAAVALYGVSGAEELLGHPILERVHPEFHRFVTERIHQVSDSHLPVASDELIHLRCDGSPVSVEVSAVPFVYESRPGGLVFVRDITERKKAEQEHSKLEKQLFQAQKMESIGRLAGGIAHDLNNLLTPILGYTELLEGQFLQDDKRLHHIMIIHQAGLSARHLVRQLLTFSRSQPLELTALDLNMVIKGFERLLRRTVRENVDIRYELSVEPLIILSDIGQLEQIIMNLAVNAEDSMPEGGVLRVETRKFDVEEDHDELHKGRWGQLVVSDSGTGIDSDTMAHIFEPFFTTKEPGDGTGFGLATVYGIVKHHNGTIHVESEPERGTIFTISFPLAEEEPEPQKNPGRQPKPKERQGTVLVVEDDEMVRTFVVQALTKNGYSVMEASRGEDALRMLQESRRIPELVISDIVMPGMNGKQLVENIRSIAPDVRVLYMSGYANNIITERGMLEEGAELLQKPFSAQVLFEKVRECFKIKRPKPKL